MRCLALFPLVLIGGVLSSASLRAADDADTCSKTGGHEGIAACGRVIASRKVSGRSLAFMHYNRGLAFLELGEHDRAIVDFDVSIRLDPSSAWTFNNRGSAWYAKGDLDRALADFSQSIRLDPNYALGYNNRGEVWKDKDEFQRAIADYSEAIRIDPAYTAGYTNRGLAYESIGDHEQARRDFNTALSQAAKYGDGQPAQNVARERLAALAANEHRPAGIGISGSPAALHAAFGRRIALVIGNSAYAATPRLANPLRDSEVIAAALRGDGFETVTLANDVTREQFVDALAAFARKAQEADWAVVYFSGHGIEIAGVNYLIPVDARLETDRDAPFQAVTLDQVLAAVAGAHKLRLIVLDSCRVNPFIPMMRITGGSRAPRGLSPPKPSSGTLVVYAAKQGQAAFDGDAGNSPFAASLAKRLLTPGIEINRLFRLVRDDVLEATRGLQEPFTYGSLPGREDYYFR